MSLPPITIPELDPAGPIDRANDLILLRQGLSDKKATVDQIANVQLNAFNRLPDPIIGSDVVFVGRRNSPTSFVNHITSLQRIGFYQGTVMWFYSPTAPLGWEPVPNTGDRILGSFNFDPTETLPGDYRYRDYGKGGGWQQQGVGGGTPGGGLSITQIPNHNHWSAPGQNQSNKHPNYIHSAQNANTGSDPKFSNSQVLGMVGGKGDNANHDNYGQCDPHNHGAQWRPSALVGLLCVKTS